MVCIAFGVTICQDSFEALNFSHEKAPPDCSCGAWTFGTDFSLSFGCLLGCGLFECLLGGLLHRFLCGLSENLRGDG